MKYIIALYAIGALFTFGDACHRYPHHLSDGTPSTGLTISAHTMTAFAWPFYWSYVAFEPAKLEATK